MAGLVTTTSRNGAGSGYADGNPTFRRFTASGTIAKPLGCTIIVMEVIGGGGGGAKANNDHGAGGAGGGGAMSRASFSADALPSSFDIVVGASAAGGTSGTANST